MIYLFLQGIVSNSGSPGYGASKYLLTGISLTLPILWLVLVTPRKPLNLVVRLSTGLLLIFAVLVAQPDSRGSALQFMSPSEGVDVSGAKTGVFLALDKAIKSGAEQIFCASDYGFPYPEGESSFEAYLCTRWGQALTGDESGLEWRFVPLNRAPKESLELVRQSFSDKRVVVIRFTDPTRPVLQSETWWSEYVDDSWTVITVR